LTRTRQASNNPEKFLTGSGAPKLDAALKDIQAAYSQDKNYRGVTYSNYLDSGVNPMSARLTSLNIPHAKFTGDTPRSLRDQAIKDYNQGKIKQLLISGAGSEGLDLKGTKLMQILEPHWNDQRLEQVRGRAVRFNSHSHLPENERVVNVKTYYSTLKDEPSTDIYLKQMSDRKTRLNNAFLKAIQDADTD
jgi:superfamily II DNA or RNA helicase